VDPVTHTLLGVTLGEAFLRPRFGSKAIVISAWAANLPDIDGLVMLMGDPGAIVLRRSFGHSLFLLPVWIAALSWLFKRKYQDLEYSDLAFIIGLNCAGHLLFDLINSFGVQLLWPFSTGRHELAIIFIIDLALAGVLAAPHLARLKASWRPLLPEFSRAALVAIVFYLALAFSARQYALLLLARETGGKGFQYAFPEPFGAHRWRGVVKERDNWALYLVTPGKGTVERRMTISNDEWSPPVRAAQETPFARRLSSFFMAPAWSTVPKAEGGWTVSVHDLRFNSLLLPRPTPFQFQFDVAAKGSGAEPREVKIW
jgi:membrane-bound metal-dependent hydrolase YbcI (DUF457 family)